MDDPMTRPACLELRDNEAHAGRAAHPQLQLQIAARTDVGLERASNQDKALVATLTGVAHSAPFTGYAEVKADGLLLAVCDGMGGAAGGEVASEEAASVVLAQLSRTSEEVTGRDTVAPRLVDALRVAARTIHAHARLDPRLRGMGTTATVAVVAEDRVVLGQVGDSRAYLFRDGTLTQLTRDQSLAQLLIEQGRLQPEEVKDFVGSNVILQAVGTSEHLDVDIRELRLGRGDVLVLCSDGLSGPVDAAAMCSVLRQAPDPATACDELIRCALAAGGPDNVTCIVARVVEVLAADGCVDGSAASP
jgi:serine/threonine protein phosphatase PrpC